MKRVLGLFKILAIYLLLAGLGCSSLKKNAAELMDNKEYGDALRIYEQVLASDPQDAEALAGRNRARLGVIQKELIEVRFLRLSGQQPQANTTLLNILKRVKDWGLYPEGAVAFTQFEEMSFASRFIERQVEEALARERPFRAESDLREWAALFPAERAASLSHLRTKTRELGIQQCGAFRDRGLKLPYFARFLARACGVWEQPEMEIPPAPELFSWMEPRVKWGGDKPDPQLDTELREKLQTAFRESPWYDPNSPTVAMADVEADYQFKDERTNVELVHGYLVQVPYDSTEVVTLSRWVPDDRTETVSDASGKYRTEVIRGSRRVEYQDAQTITRLRDEVRSIPYGALKIQVEGQLKWDLRWQAGVFDEAQKTFAGRKDEILIQHSNDSPEVRLRPQSPRVPTRGEVFTELASRLSREVGAELGTLWRRQFCRAPRTTEWRRLTENVHRCLYGAGGETPDYAQQWLTRELGVSSVEMAAMIRGVTPTPASPRLPPAVKNRSLSSSSETPDRGP